jgi:hypothetical protein
LSSPFSSEREDTPHIHTAVAKKERKEGGRGGGRKGRKDKEKEKAFADEPL